MVQSIPFSAGKYLNPLVAIAFIRNQVHTFAFDIVIGLS